MDGIVREVREELGVEIEVVEGPILLAPHPYGPDGAHVLAIGFSTRIIEGEPNPTDEVAEIRWISMEVIDDTDFAWEHDRGFVQAALEDAKSSDYIACSARELGTPPPRWQGEKHRPARQALQTRRCAKDRRHLTSCWLLKVLTYTLARLNL